MIKHLNQMVAEAASRKPRRLVVAYGQDTHSIGAAWKAIQADIVEVTLIGDRSTIEQSCKAVGAPVEAFEIVDEKDENRCIELAVRMVNEGRGEVLMKGLVSTDKYMRGILNKEWGLMPPKATLSHVTVLEIPTYHKLLIISDVAVIPLPDLDQKKAMIRYLAQTARVLGIERPKIACLAPSEQLLPKVVSSVDSALLTVMAQRGQLGANIVVDGPMAIDVAVDKESAQTKKVVGEVAGDADCLLFPNIEAGNTFYKACTKFCGADLASIVAGTTAPCVLTSRGDSINTKLYAIALACLSCKNK